MRYHLLALLLLASTSSFGAKAPQTITFGAIPTLAAGGTGSVSATSSSGLPVSLTASPVTVCSIGGSSITSKTFGTCTITANQIGNASFLAATPVKQTIVIPATSQTITFDHIQNLTIGAVGTLAATSSSGLPLVLTSSTPLICSVANTAVTAKAAGTCTVVASRAGNSIYGSATSVSQSTVVPKSDQTITLGNMPSEVTMASTLVATSDSKLPVVYATTTTDKCQVVGNTVIPKTAGKCTVTVDQPGNASYNAAKQVTTDITIGQQNQKITFGPAPIFSPTVSKGLVIAFSSSRLPITLTSKTPLTCSLDTFQNAVLVGSGTCTIEADQPGNADFNPALPVMQSFMMVKQSQIVTFVAAPRLTLPTLSGTLTATATSGLPISYRTQTPSTCVAVANTPPAVGGSVVGIYPGICTVAAFQLGDAKYEQAQAYQTIVVPKLAQSLTFTQPVPTSIVGGTLTKIIATSSAGLPVTFSSKTPGICTTVQYQGYSNIVVTGAGLCTIAADQAGNATYNAAPTIIATFTTTAGSQTVTFAPISNMIYGTSLTLTNFASSSSKLPVSFSSSTPLNCSVASYTNLLVAKGGGTCTIIAIQGGGSGYLAAPQVTQTFTVVPTTQSIVTDVPIPAKLTQKIPVNLAFHATSNLPILVVSNTLSICNVTKIATVTGIATGTCNLTVLQAGNANYNSVSKDINIPVL